MIQLCQNSVTALLTNEVCPWLVWLPNSEYCIDEDALLDFEYYDERWDCQFGAAQMDIYVPVKRMED